MTATPETAQGNSRKPVLIAMLLVLVLLGVWSEWDRRSLLAEMAPTVAVCVSEVTAPEVETRGIATVSREYLLAGTPRAKVEVFCVSGSGKTAAAQGFEFYYVKTGGEWNRTGSGRCTSESCQLRAQEVFAATEPAAGKKE